MKTKTNRAEELLYDIDLRTPDETVRVVIDHIHTADGWIDGNSDEGQRLIREFQASMEAYSDVPKPARLFGGSVISEPAIVPENRIIPIATNEIDPFVRRSELRGVLEKLDALSRLLSEAVILAETAKGGVYVEGKTSTLH